jgi:hypothetical protein
MPTLPLPLGTAVLHGGDVPVSDEADVAAEFPRPHRTPTAAPVRDAFTGGWTAGFLEYQNIAARAAAQSDPLRATGDYLKSFAEEHSVIPGADESEESVRSRLFSAPDIVTPDAIVRGVDALLAPYTTKTCRFSELELDGFFVHDGTAEWDSFVGTDPDYPDRYYDDLPHRLPGGAVPSSGYLRSFLLRIPALEDNDDAVSFAFDAPVSLVPSDITDDYEGIFVADGTGDGTVGLSVYTSPQRADYLYAAIVGLVTSIKGQGFSWTLLVDPTL